MAAAEKSLAESSLMTKPPQRSKPKAGNPVPPEPQIAASSPPAEADPAHLLASLQELQKDVGALRAKSENLTSDIRDLKFELSEVKKIARKAELIRLATIVLMPLFILLIWWLIDKKIDMLRDEVVKASSQAASSLQYLPIPPGSEK